MSHKTIIIRKNVLRGSQILSRENTKINGPEDQNVLNSGFLLQKNIKIKVRKSLYMQT